MGQKRKPPHKPQMLEFLFNAGLSDTTGVQLQYNGFSTSFIQSAIVAGPPTTKQNQDAAVALWLFNTSFGEADFTHIWNSGAQTAVNCHMHVNFAANFSGNGLVTQVMEWFNFGIAGQPVFTLKLDGLGTMQVIASETGKSVGILSTTFLYNTWYELVVETSVVGGWTVKIDGAVVAQSSSPVSPTRCDRATVRWQGGGPPGVAWTNYVLWDDRTGDGFTSDPGPCWISTIPVYADVNTIWPAAPGPHVYTALQDLSPPFGHDINGSPDGDDSFAGPPISNTPPQMFQCRQSVAVGSPCFGLILAIAAVVCARPTGANQLLDVWVRPSTAIFNLGVLQIGPPSGTQFTRGAFPALDNYATQQVLSTVNPATNAAWIDSQIGQAQWGFGPDSFDQLGVRVTQFYLLKLTSLGTQPYSCGGGPYVY